MAHLFGADYRREDLLRRVGNIAQVAGIREYTHRSGRANGVRAIEVNAGDLRFELLADRCLDIASASYKGIPLGYHSKSGIRHPSFFAKNDPTGHLDNFLGGLMTTCGLHNIGPACECAGRPHRQHGEIANMPAEKLCVREVWDGDNLAFHVEGEVHHSGFYHADLVLRRRVSARLGAGRLTIEDEVENLDFAPTPCLVLYHAQFGFPFLGENSRLLASQRTDTVHHIGGPDSDTGPPPFDTFGPPRDGMGEDCYCHSFKPDAEGWAAACLFNPELGERGLGAYVRYRTDTLPFFVEWRMLRSREYVCGLEPASAPLVDRSDADIAAATLQPLEKRRFRLELGVVEGEEEFANLLKQGDNHG